MKKQGEKTESEIDNEMVERGKSRKRKTAEIGRYRNKLKISSIERERGKGR